MSSWLGNLFRAEGLGLQDDEEAATPHSALGLRVRQV